jgi:3-methyladenine DNA glycosylase/8-oxoguanine DNA glycosylase
MHWTLTVPDGFSLSQIIRRSLNCEQSKLEQFRLLLPPFSVNRTKERLNRVERLQSDNTVYLTLSQTPAGLILQTEERLSGKDTEEISHKTRRMLRLGENLRPFLDIARRTPGLETTLQNGAHILRGATLFEDVIKAVILTHEEKAQQGQDIAWIVDRIGDPLPSNPTRHAFPTPEQILSGEHVLRETFAPDFTRKLIRVAEKFCREAERIEALTQEERPADALAARLAKLLSLEPETLGLVMLSLGRYDYIPATLCAQWYTRSSNNGRRGASRDTRAMFEPLQPWGGLACWLWDWSSANTADANNLAGGVEWRV